MNSVDSAIKLNIQNKFERWGSSDSCDECPFHDECCIEEFPFSCFDNGRTYLCERITGKTFGEMKESINK